MAEQLVLALLGVLSGINLFILGGIYRRIERLENIIMQGPPYRDFENHKPSPPATA